MKVKWLVKSDFRSAFLNSVDFKNYVFSSIRLKKTYRTLDSDISPQSLKLSDGWDIWVLKKERCIITFPTI